LSKYEKDNSSALSERQREIEQLRLENRRISEELRVVQENSRNSSGQLGELNRRIAEY